MARGDSVEYVTTTGYTGAIVVETIGRSLEVSRGSAWLTVTERTRSGKPSGNELRARMEALASYRVVLRKPVSG